MRIRVEVVGQTLNLRGPCYAVGERLFLDSDDPMHRQVIDEGWVRPIPHASDSPHAPNVAVVEAIDEPPQHKMVQAAPHKAMKARGVSKSGSEPTS